ncbi:hypothetical protein HMPREF1040_1305 [Megasphaera sp. UPII 135-E]|nr:hypothetical protein HMPREF1040_1305 [Megasphaera sp. UPII 135-E]
MKQVDIWEKKFLIEVNKIEKEKSLATSLFFCLCYGSILAN